MMSSTPPRRLFVAGAAAAALIVAACGESGQQRNGIWAAGSSTVFPFATRVAENFGRNNPEGAPPRVESLGTGGGIQAFCQGLGPRTPDIANASRRMKASEFDQCVENGVSEIIEIKIGYDGLVVATARSGADFVIAGSDLYLALAKEVPGPNGEFIANPYRTWAEVRPGLPQARIQVYGPPPTSGTRNSWVELAMTPSAEAVPQLAELAESDPDRFEAIAHTLREDGAWIELRRERQCHRPDPDPDAGVGRGVRILLPRGEYRRGEAGQRQRRVPGSGNHRLG